MEVFRLQDTDLTGLANNTGWFQSSQYNTNEINAILDPDGGRGADPTSIPSPFARIDLVRTAFKFVNRHGINGNTSFHRIVSHAFDIGEIFFNYELYDGNIQIVEWHKQDKVKDLTGAPVPEHIRYGQTLDMFLVQDALGFNFNLMNRIFMLRYNNQIIGGTSPVSLFFSSANAMNDLGITFPGGNHAFTAITPLYRRDKNFIRFIYALRSSDLNFAALFPEIFTYLNNALVRLDDPQLQLEINGYTQADYLTYPDIDDGIFILNDIPLKKKSPMVGPIISDFTMQPGIFQTGNIPLVLKKGHPGIAPDGSPMRYWQGYWSPTIDVPYKDEREMKARTLPGLTGVNYPYLTIGDFLEEYLIEIPYPLNSNRFFDGHYIASGNGPSRSYMLPVRKEFFKYFTKDFLTNEFVGNDKRRVFEIKHLAGGNVEVLLRIPIRKGFIEYRRTYYTAENPNIANNEGAIKKCKFDLAVYPFFRFVGNASPEYRMALIDGDIDSTTYQRKYSLKLFDVTHLSSPIEPSHNCSRVQKIKNEISGLNHYVFKQNFDFIDIEVREGDKSFRGMLIPTLPDARIGGQQFSFYIDLGTTYTHIEYSVNNAPPQPFDVTQADIQLVKLHDPDFNMFSVFSEVTEVFDREFLPEIIGTGQLYSFPVRTSILELKTVQAQQVCYAYAERNIPFTYEKSPGKDYTRIISGLKWGTDNQASSRIESFIECILLLIRNKVLMNRGNLANTRIVWFYPLSMMAGRRNILSGIWEEFFEKFISPQLKSLQSVSESLAPFCYYHSVDKVISQDNPVISIDIGGETSDVVIFIENKPALTTSFRFAADAAFGNNYRKDSASKNKFVQEFGQKIDKTFELHDELKFLKQVYKDILNSQQLRDVVAFFFSLENNMSIGEEVRKDLSFNKWLKENEKHKIVFLTFYASIVYHVAKILKTKDLPFPLFFTFSGTGSKILKTLFPKKNTNERFTRILLLKVLNKISNENDKDDKYWLKVKQNPSPKELTCKGGHYYLPDNEDEENEDHTIIESKIILLGTTDDLIYNDSNAITYGDVNKNIKDEVVKEVNTFIDLLFNILNENKELLDELMIDKLKLDDYQGTLKKKLLNYIDEGIDLKKNEEKQINKQILEETLFFYAIKGGIDNLIDSLPAANNANN